GDGQVSYNYGQMNITGDCDFGHQFENDGNVTITNGSLTTYNLFNYGDIQWTSGNGGLGYSINNYGSIELESGNVNVRTIANYGSGAISWSGGNDSFGNLDLEEGSSANLDGGSGSLSIDSFLMSASYEGGGLYWGSGNVTVTNAWMADQGGDCYLDGGG